MLLVDIQEAWSHRHGGIAKQWKQSTAVEKEVGGKPLGADSIENGRVDAESLEVYSAGEVRVKAL